ncbi:MAG: hypothetical protein ACKVVT_15930 [Dehalococcoidia bacterium]
MAEPVRDWLHDLLEADARAFDYPPVPPLAVQSDGRRRAATWRQGLAFAALAVVVALAVALVVPKSREAVAEFFGLRVRGAQVQVEPLPVATATATGTDAARPTPAPEGVALPLARDAARALLGFEPVLPSGQDEPALYSLAYLGARVLVAVYPGFALWQTDSFIFAKGVPNARAVEEAEVGGRPAYWFEVGERFARILRPDGSEVAGTERVTSGRALIWSDGAVTFRLESATLSRAELLAIAETVR